MVYLCSQTGISYPSVNGVSKVKCCGTLRQSFYLSSWRKHKNLRSKEIHLDCIQKVDSIRVGVRQHLLNSFEPFFQLIILLHSRCFILPVSCKTFLCDIIHAAASDLNFNPTTIRPHHRQV